LDPLSDVLSLLKPRSYVSSGVDAGGKWSIQFPDQNRLIKCYAVVSGECWLTVDGVAGSAHLKRGDCFALASGRSFRLASDTSLPPEPSGKYFPPPRPGAVVTINGGGDVFLVGSRFGVSGGHVDMLMGMLPPIVHIRSESEQAALRWSVERMMQELHDPEPGGCLIAQHLAHMMLVQTLRLQVKQAPAVGTGWLFGIVDRQLGPAIGAVHADPAYRWTLQKLAERACMSRSGFAQKFRETIGTSPMEYVTRWRMLLAGDRLENSSDSVSAIALSLGYESESAFSAAFKRVMGASPRRYGQASTPAPNGRTGRLDGAGRAQPDGDQR
jgi:AraC-like DNA-binding protein